MVLVVLVVTKASSCWICAFIVMCLVVMFAPAAFAFVANLTNSWQMLGFVASSAAVNTSIPNVDVLCIGQYNESTNQRINESNLVRVSNDLVLIVLGFTRLAYVPEVASLACVLGVARLSCSRRCMHVS